jgi:hypothetical protein
VLSTRHTPFAPVQPWYLKTVQILDQILYGFIGFLLPVVPEAAVALLCIRGALALLIGSSRRLRALEFAALLFAVTQAWLAFRAGQSVFLAFIPFVVIVLLALSTRVELPRIPFFWGAFIGLIAVLGLAAWDGLGLKSTPPDRWVIQPELVRANLGEISRFAPMHVQNSWFVADLGLQGSGRIEYELEIKASKPFTLSISLIRMADGRSAILRTDKTCEVTIDWKKCSVRMNIEQRGRALMALGGYETWKRNGSVLFLRDKQLRVIDQIPPLDRLKTPSRVQGSYFNENALGAVFSILGLLLLLSAPTVWIKIPMLFLFLAGVALSGSRNAFIAFFWSVVAVFWSEKLKPIFLLVPVGIFIVFFYVLGNRYLNQSQSVQTSNPVSRIFFVNDQKSFVNRSEIYLGSAKLFVDQPMGGHTHFVDSLNRKLGFSTREIAHSHNIVFQLAASGGILAITTFSTLLFCLVARGILQKNSRLLLFLCAYLTVNLFDYLFFFAPLHAAFWLAVSAFGSTARQAVSNTRTSG